MNPVWLGETVVLAIHGRLLSEHGGADGIRSTSLFESALARPKNLLAYDNPDICDLAAACTTGIIRNHPFVDGNKRTGFMAAYVFLASNGLQLMADELDVVRVIMLLAASEIDETEFAAWLKKNCESA